MRADLGEYRQPGAGGRRGGLEASAPRLAVHVVFSLSRSSRSRRLSPRRRPVSYSRPCVAAPFLAPGPHGAVSRHRVAFMIDGGSRGLGPGYLPVDCRRMISCVFQRSSYEERASSEWNVKATIGVDRQTVSSRSPLPRERGDQQEVNW